MLIADVHLPKTSWKAVPHLGPAAVRHRSPVLYTYMNVYCNAHNMLVSSIFSLCQ